MTGYPALSNIFNKTPFRQLKIVDDDVIQYVPCVYDQPTLMTMDWV